MFEIPFALSECKMLLYNCIGWKTDLTLAEKYLDGVDRFANLGNIPSLDGADFAYRERLVGNRHTKTFVAFA